MQLTSVQKCAFGFALALLSMLYSSHAHAAGVSKTCREPLLEAVDKAERSLKKPFTYIITAPVECQYFKMSDLDTETQDRIKTLVQDQGKSISLDTKLTAVFGLIKLTAVTKTKAMDPCEELFFDLQQKKKKYSKIVSSTADRKECFKVATAFTDSLKTFLPECDIALEVTTRDFRDLFSDLKSEYMDATQKVLSSRLSYAYAAYKDYVYKMLTEKCGNL